MNLERFNRYLLELDHRVGCPKSHQFQYLVKQVDTTTFTFVFDGLVCCAIRFNDDGSVDENQDVDPSKPITEYHKHFASHREWIENVCEELALPIECRR